MDTIKSTLYNTLLQVGYYIAQSDQAIFGANLPAVTFGISNNVNRLGLDNTILSQDVEIKLDIWASKSTEASSALSAVEAKLREVGYTLTYTQDVPNPDAGLFHITTRFTTSLVIQ
jgi:hypothetical protein